MQRCTSMDCCQGCCQRRRVDDELLVAPDVRERSVDTGSRDAQAATGESQWTWALSAPLASSAVNNRSSRFAVDMLSQT